MEERLSDLDYMQLALGVGERALATGEVPVGCVFVDSTTGKVVASGHNRTNATKNAATHAEIVCIDSLTSSNHAIDFTQLEVFVTCEPCIMCAAALSEIKVRRIVYGCANDRFGGCGSVLHVGKYTANGLPPVESGLCKDAAIDLFTRFYARENDHVPAAKRHKS
jgi:tRNA-specific adenosine deaminase 2